MDNPNTYKPTSLHKRYPATEARRIIKRLEIHYTLKYGNWLDIAEIELNVMIWDTYLFLGKEKRKQRAKLICDY